MANVFDSAQENACFLKHQFKILFMYNRPSIAKFEWMCVTFFNNYLILLSIFFLTKEENDTQVQRILLMVGL